jgi:cysteinyl-tRNA synthetase
MTTKEINLTNMNSINTIPKLYFFNSRSKTNDVFTHPNETPINIYTCGPTVYDIVHLGNLKTFLMSDFIVSLLQALGYKTNHIMNITDIDDKIIARLDEQTHESLIKYTSYYTEKFIEDIEKLGIRNYNKNNIHKVTDNIDKIEEMIITLMNKEFAYQVPDGSIYFDSTKVTNNPFHRNCDTSNYNSGRNIIRADGIRNNADFVLWKVKADREIKFGKILKPGSCGWHIECSAICANILDKVHISMGGSDLQTPHHECSISQSEAYKPGQVYGNYWIHFGFLNFTGEKMSKSIGNVLRLDDIKHNYKLIRMYLLSKSYKNNVEYSDNEIQLMKKDFVNFHLLYNKLNNKFYKESKNSEQNYVGETNIYDKILVTVSNNIDTSNGLKILFDYVNKFMKIYLTTEIANTILIELDRINNLFNILDEKLLFIDENTLNFIKEREEFRKLKQFDKTDTMRDELKNTFIFEDDNTGFSLIHNVD